MKKKKTKVFLTGATGVMGMSGLKELLQSPEKYSVAVLARPSKKNKKQLAPYIKKGIRVIWGDLLDEKAIRDGVKFADIILHVGGMVSPLAEHYPERTMKVNVGSMELISSLVKEKESNQPFEITKVVYIGSVSQYGSKLPPNHWGKVGDPQVAAKFDTYSLSKIKAEEVLKNSGIKKWVSIRQTSILHSGLLKKIDDPVIFHTPLQGVLEWITVEDSGRLLERVCREEVPDDFWCKCYNAGGGETFRLTNLEFERKLLEAIGCPPPEKIFEPNWFATQNFHGMWFEDSDQLEAILHYRSNDTFDAALLRMKEELPFYFKFTPIVPGKLIKIFMKRVAQKSPLGPLSWINKNDKARIEAYWGSKGNYEKIKGWEDFEEIRLSVIPKKSLNL